MAVVVDALAPRPRSGSATLAELLGGERNLRQFETALATALLEGHPVACTFDALQHGRVPRPPRLAVGRPAW